jgi:3-oxoacyl-[acyl-carrier protein] reductase
MDLGVAERGYLITGGSRGLGFATAQALAGEGARVTITGRDPGVLEAAVARLGPDARGVVADNADPDTPDRLVDAVLSEHGRLDGVVVSVGGPPPTSVLDTPDEVWRSAFETVFLGALRIARRCVRDLTPPGGIALVLSSSVRSPIPGLAVSNGLRPGLAMAIKNLADEIGPRGLRAFGVAPGQIATERFRAVQRGGSAAAGRGSAAIPLGRVGEPEEFGRVTAFLISPVASYVTGFVVPIDGGLMRTP